jgi:mxaK protein
MLFVGRVAVGRIIGNQIYRGKSVALRSKLHRWLRGVCVILLGLIAVDGYSWWKTTRLNSSIADGSIIAETATLPAQVKFAQAYYYAQKGDRERSIALYKQVEHMPDLEMAHAAQYNRANGYLIKAMELSGTDNQNLALPLAELAKDTYRSLLRADPKHWDAKYNLERALRLVPDPDDSNDAELPPPQQSERAPTTMRGFTLGLP